MTAAFSLAVSENPNGTFSVIATTATNSTATGALTVVGGLGVGGGLFVGGIVTATNIYINGYVVNTGTVNSGTLMTTSVSLAGGTAGQLVYQSAPNASAFINTATTGNFLQANYVGAPTWTSTGSMYVYRATVADTVNNFNTSTLMALAVTAQNLAGGAYGSIPVQSGTGTTSFITAGTQGQILVHGVGQGYWASTSSIYVNRATVADSVNSSVTFNNGNSGAASGSTFNGSSAVTVSANTLGALSLASGGTVSGAVTFTGPVTFSGTSTNVLSTNTFYTDNIIDIHAPSGGVNNPWFVDDGKDIGLRFHYYTAGTDTNAALVLANDTKWLEWYSAGAEGTSTFSGSAYGNFKTGGVWATTGAGVGYTASQVGEKFGVNGGAYVNGILTATNIQVGNGVLIYSSSLLSPIPSSAIRTNPASGNIVINGGGGTSNAVYFGYDQVISGGTYFSQNTSVLAYVSTTSGIIINNGTTAYSGAQLSVNGGAYVNGTLTATTLIGNLTGTATNATNLATIQQTANATYYPTFVSSNPASSTNLAHYTTSSFTVNPASGLVTVSGSSGDGVPILRVTGTTAPASGFNWAASFMNSSLTTSKNTVILIGQAESSKNSGYIGYNYAGTTNSNNSFLTFGMYTVDNIMNITGAGQVGIGTTAPTAKLLVDGGGTNSVALRDDSIENHKNASDTAGIAVHYYGYQAGTSYFRDFNIYNGKNGFIAKFQGSSSNLGIGTATPGQLVDAYRSSNADVVYQITNDSTGGAATAQFFANNGTTRTQFFHTGVSYSGSGVLASAPGLGGVYNTTAQGLALIAANASGVIKFATGSSNTERVRIDSSGNVGIGTTAPNSKLDIRFAALSSTTQLNHILLQSLADGANNQLGARTGITFNNRTVDYVSSGGTSTAGVYGVSTDNSVYARAMGLVFYTSAIDAAATEKLRIDSSGNVGIGTTAPGTTGAKLEVTGSIQTTWGSAYRIGQVYDNSYRQGMALDGNGRNLKIFSTSNDSNGVITFLTRVGLGASDTDYGTERVRIDQSGNVGIGTTSPSALLDINGNIKSGSYHHVHYELPSFSFGSSSITDEYLILARLYEGTAIASSGVIGEIIGGRGSTSSGNSVCRTKLNITCAYTYNQTSEFTTTGSRDFYRIDILTISGVKYYAAKARESGGPSDLGSYFSGYRFANSTSLVLTRVRSSDAGVSVTTVGALYPTQIAQYTDTGDVVAETGGSERLRITSAGNVGIGTTAPAFTHGSGLQVNASTVATVRVQYNSGYATELFADSNGTNLYQLSSANLMLGTSNTERMRIASGGNVGIGTTSPDAKLVINQVQSAYDQGVPASSGTTQPAGLRIKSGDNVYGETLDFGMNVTTAGSYGWIQATNYTGLSTNYKLALNPNGGFVGVGTYSPATKLHLYESGASDIALRLTPSNGSYDALLQMTGQDGNMATEGFEIWYSNTVGDAHFSTTYPNDAASIHFHTRTGASKSTSNERLTILGGGNVGIGTTSPSYKFVVAGSNSSSTPLVQFNATGTSSFQRGVQLFNTSMSAGDSIMYSVGTADSSRQMGQMYYVYAGSNSVSNRLSFGLHSVDDVLNILGSGNVGIGTTNPQAKLHVSGSIYATGDVVSSYSDLRLKTVLGKIENAVEKVSAIETFYYEANETALKLGALTGRKVGVSAQSVKEVAPEVVNTSPLSEEYMTVQYERLVPLLIEAVKEQQATIEQQQAQINTLIKKLGLE